MWPGTRKLYIGFYADTVKRARDSPQEKIDKFRKAPQEKKIDKFRKLSAKSSRASLTR